MDEVLAFLGHFSWLDYLALGWFAVCSIGYSAVTIRSGREGQSHSFIDAVFAQRRRWMLTMAQRDVRIPDVQILLSFNQMTGFFATTSVLILGALGAVLFAGDAGREAFQSLSFIGPTSAEVWTAKLSLLIVLFVSAFFKFVWAQRLVQYLAVAIGATPLCDAPQAALRDKQVILATTLANRASVQTYTGLHAYYFAVAALTWFVHPAVFILATTLVVAALYRREYLSDAARAIREAAAEE